MKRIIAMAVAGAFATSFAYAEGSKAKSTSAGSSAPSSSTALFKDLDKNHDGSLSKEEAKGAPWAKDFAKLDKNHDGKLSQQEYAAVQSSSGAGSTSDPSSRNTSKKY